MCGRYNFTDEQLDEIKQIIKEVNERLYGQKVKTGEVRPTDLAAVLVWDDNKMVPEPARWGFPKWNGSGTIINARAETALEKPMFRVPLLTRRCVVPSAGYYEWRRVDGKRKKDKYHLSEPDKSILFMAGMVSAFSDSDGRQYSAFTILTTTANDSVSQLHDRMPLILQKEELEAWLRDVIFMQLVLTRNCPDLVMAQVTTDTEKNNIQTSLF